MGKTSSRKKKRSKISSKKSRKTSKSRKLKSKKLQNRDDSLSYSDGGSSTFSSSDSEDDNRRRKHRSSTKKKGKKRAKRLSSSSEDYSSLRRKRSRKNAYEAKKKTNSRKKRKRDLSISSYSSESRSCSTCRSESIRTIESEFDSGRRSAKRHNKKRDLENSKSVNKYRGHRSRSCSPYSSCGQRSNHSANEEKFVEYNYNSKRLKSVIVVLGDENRGHRNEERVEEITFGDSAFEEELMLDNGRKGEVIFDSRNLKLGDTEKDSKFRSKETPVPVVERNTNFSGDIVSRNDVDMEMILRQKALENLKRFRGRVEKSTKPDANEKVECERDANSSYFGEVDACDVIKKDGHMVIDQESLKLDNGNTVRSKPCKGEDIKTIMATEAVKGIDLGKEQSAIAHSSEAISDGGGLKPGSSYSAIDESMDQVINKSEEKGSDQQSIEHYSAPTEPPSSIAIMSRENSSSTKALNDSKEGAQFEQKTMSVMRGGEMVEVSYKVYIPKKKPALNRRQLKR